jgi:cellulose synthase/poly-beta-1,6-N-acetylglucosamine synthase-like glycosyltransferase
MNLLAEIFILSYCLLMIIFIIIWVMNKYDNNADSNIQEKGFSVLIPVRNEAKNIGRLLQSLVEQQYKYFEVLLIDDSSEDNTVEIAQAFLSRLDLSILSLSNTERGVSPKKNGITKALALVKYDLIFCTDGDCVLSQNLLREYNGIFKNEKVKFISGPVTFMEEKSGFWERLWEKVQIIEFASLVGSAAVSIFLKKPNMCSGANMAYRKSVFFEVNGYEGNTELASGDDEFLMHKINTKFKDAIVFANSSEAIVETQACSDLWSFYRQRKRWASKWTYYDSIIPKLLAVFVFLLNVFSIYLAFSGVWVALSLKLALEIIFLGMVLSFLKKKGSIVFIPLVQIIYPFYVVFFGLNAVFMGKTYDWKGRKLK